MPRPIPRSLPLDEERYVHEPSAVPPLVRCGLLHYQFETLHSFLDGNGRLGRLLIVLFLVSEGHLPEPLLYVSAHFEQHRDAYCERLQGVRERGEMQEWLRFFLAAVATQATDALSRAERLTDLREDYRRRLRGSRSRAHEIVEMLLEIPFVTSAGATRRSSVSNQGARNQLRQLEQAGHRPTGRQGTRPVEPLVRSGDPADADRGRLASMIGARLGARFKIVIA
ncbi:MAG: Fic family protein [Acidimicrobiales bacterium]